MTKIEILSQDGTVIGFLEFTKKGAQNGNYIYGSPFGDKIIDVVVERTSKGLWMTYSLPPYYEDIVHFITNKRLRFLD